MRILYVENHAIFAAQVCQQFLAAHTVMVVSSLATARKALASENYDLLLVDYDLDDGKGDELVKACRLSHPGLKIIAVSAHDAGNAALLAAGASAICGKMEFDKIQSVIDAIALLWWVIPGVLAGMPMPFIHPDRRMNQGGPLGAYDDDLPVLHAAGVRTVVSLLNIPSDASVYESAGFAFLCLPVADGGAPTMDQANDFVRFVFRQREERRAVAVHCEAGLGRTGTMLAAYLVSQGETAEEAIRHVRSVEKAALETARQVHFVEMFASYAKSH
jgi:CheY-like chemotaxis protein